MTTTTTTNNSKRKVSIKPNYAGIGKLILKGMFGAIVMVGSVKLCELMEGRCEEESQLEFRTENFHLDPSSYKLFARLQKWAKIDPGAWNDFEQCLRATDSLLQIESELRKPNPKVDMQDVVRSDQLFKIALTSFRAFSQQIRSKCQAAEVQPIDFLLFERDVEMLEHFLLQHLVCIYKFICYV